MSIISTQQKPPPQVGGKVLACLVSPPPGLGSILRQFRPLPGVDGSAVCPDMIGSQDTVGEVDDFPHVPGHVGTEGSAASLLILRKLQLPGTRAPILRDGDFRPIRHSYVAITPLGGLICRQVQGAAEDLRLDRAASQPGPGLDGRITGLVLDRDRLSGDGYCVPSGVVMGRDHDDGVLRPGVLFGALLGDGVGAVLVDAVAGHQELPGKVGPGGVFG